MKPGQGRSFCRRGQGHGAVSPHPGQDPAIILSCPGAHFAPEKNPAPDVDPLKRSGSGSWLADWHPIIRASADTSVRFMFSPKGKDSPCSA